MFEVFPNAKINIGLYVTSKRGDGFHNLESVFYPIQLVDRLSIRQIRDADGYCSFINKGIHIDCNSDANLVVKAYRLLAEEYRLPAVEVELEKHIPFGAGLGGGSSDAAFMLKALNQYFELKMGEKELMSHAAMLGSDCIFFIKNTPAFVSGRGEIVEENPLSLEHYEIVILHPELHISTGNAYAMIKPTPAPVDLRELYLHQPIEWKECVSNDFEKSVFALYPEVEELKALLYKKGAVYASMTGSGSSVYGIFNKGQLEGAIDELRLQCKHILIC